MCSKNCEINHEDLERNGNCGRISCSCHNISFKVQNVQKKNSQFSSKVENFDYSNLKAKHHRHVFYLNYKSVNILDTSAVIIHHTSTSIFHVTCLNCRNDFNVHCYESHALMKASKTNYTSKSISNENQVNFQYNEKKTMNFFFPLELRKFCTFENSINDKYLNYEYDKSRDNDIKTRKNIGFKNKAAFKPSIEKELDRIGNDFDDSFGAVFFHDMEPIVGPYTSSPVLNWNVANAY